MAVTAQSPRANAPRFQPKRDSSDGKALASRSMNSGSSRASDPAKVSNPDRAANGQLAFGKTRPAVPQSGRPNQSRGGGKPAGTADGGQNKPEAEILFQKYFKSVGPRTYAAQLKRAGNGNHFLVLTEAKRNEKTGEPRKTRLYVFSEDFVAFFKMLHETAQFIRQNPVPDDVRQRRERYWSKNGGRKNSGTGA
jgi:hypothetical protein